MWPIGYFLQAAYSFDETRPYCNQIIALQEDYINQSGKLNEIWGIQGYSQSKIKTGWVFQNFKMKTVPTVQVLVQFKLGHTLQ